MLIKLVHVSKNPFYLRADQIRMIERSSANPLITVVQSLVFIPGQGFMSYEVLDNIDELAVEINRVLGMYRMH